MVLNGGPLLDTSSGISAGGVEVYQLISRSFCSRRPSKPLNGLKLEKTVTLLSSAIFITSKEPGLKGASHN